MFSYEKNGSPDTDHCDSKRKYAYPTPLVTGTGAVGRIAAVGPDAVLLKEGDLVFFDCTIRGRDDEGAIMLSGIAEGGTDASRKLSKSLNFDSVVKLVRR